MIPSIIHFGTIVNILSTFLHLSFDGCSHNSILIVAIIDNLLDYYTKNYKINKDKYEVDVFFISSTQILDQIDQYRRVPPPARLSGRGTGKIAAKQRLNR